MPGTSSEDSRAGKLLRRTVAREIGIPPVDRGEPIQDVAGLLTPVEEIARRHRLAVVEALVSSRRDDDGSVHARLSERPQDQRIDQRECRRIRGQSDREDHRNCG